MGGGLAGIAPDKRIGETGNEATGRERAGTRED